MKTKQLIVILALIALLLTGCSRQSATSANDAAGTQSSEAAGASSSPTEMPTEAETAAPTIAPANVDPDATYEYEVREIWT